MPGQLTALPLTLRAYRRIAAAAAPLAPLLLRRRLKRGKEDAQRLHERRGEARSPRPEGPLIWVHGASVGEMISVIPLIAEIRARGLNVLVTSHTVTSAHLATQRLPEGVIHQFVPLDAPRFTARFVAHWKPSLALFAESDLWPNLILAASQAGIPLILVNGRVSERSFRRWRMARRTISTLLRRFDLCLGQSDRDAARLTKLGAQRVIDTGNLKLDVPAPPADAQALQRLAGATEGRVVFAAASTHAGEEALLLEAHRLLQAQFPNLLTIIAPRHPERGSGVASIAAAARLSALRRSTGGVPDAQTDVYVVDSIGELGLIYRLAPIVFLGGSLVRHGGQNPIEAAKLGSAVLHGPHVWNFKEIYAALDGADGARLVETPGQVSEAVQSWLEAPERRDAVAANAQQTLAVSVGALARTLAVLDPYLMQLRLEQP